MKAGFAEKEYTPAEGAVPGQIKVLYANGKITPLMAHVAVLESDGCGAVIVSLDILFVSNAFATHLRHRISEITGYPFDQIMVVCTHTHTGCATDCVCWDFNGKPEYLSNVETAVFEALEEARTAMTDVKLGIGCGYDRRFHFCRDFYVDDGRIVMNPAKEDCDGHLVRPYAAIDDSVNVMRFDAVDGTPLCFIVNYANHLDTNPSKAKFDADFPGHMRVALREAYGDVAVLFLNGCCANINHYDYANQSHKTLHCAEGALPPAVIGAGLAETVKAIDPPIRTAEGNFRIQGVSRMHVIPRRSASEQQIAWAKELMQTESSGSSNSLRLRLLAELYLEDEQNPPSPITDFEISVLQIGPWTIVGLPGEIYSDIGLKIKASSPFANTIVVEIANGYNGYVSPDIIQRSGCYEGRYSKVAYTGLGTEKVLVDGSADLLAALFHADNVKTFGSLKERQ